MKPTAEMASNVNAGTGLQQEGGAPPVSPQVLAELFRTGFLSDVTLKFEGAEIRAHKLVLADKSKWFKEAFEGDYEFATAVDIPLHALGVSAERALNMVLPLTALVRFCYTGSSTYSPSAQGHWTPHLTSSFYITLHHLASHYGIPALATRCKEHYRAVSGVSSANLVSIEGRFSALSHGLHHHTLQVVQTLTLRAYKQELDKLQREGKYKEALQWMKLNPRVTSQLYDQFGAGDDDAGEPAREWKCAGCSAVFLYTKPAKRMNLQLRSCPCCAVEEEGRRDLPGNEGARAGNNFVKIED
ncbi:hypothetical protein BDV95DRAFT_597532 [Massariosphaeria phaeospora]|uniref:BTB domain-containing protein n=1 Tax=Massariosphaeria phaeospora TaxID=100035 RepID=A0A7C8M5A6_9PLEO|nr:hypothetical protein BDV95DRAFT_597532 [Massariosphaeria phaeospora]